MYRRNAASVWASTPEVARLYKWSLHSLSSDPSIPHQDCYLPLLLNHTTISAPKTLYMEGTYQLGVRRFKTLTSDAEPRLIQAFTIMLPMIGRRILDRVEFHDNTRMRLFYASLDVEDYLEDYARYTQDCLANGLEPEPIPEEDRRTIWTLSNCLPFAYFPDSGSLESMRTVLESLYANS